MIIIILYQFMDKCILLDKNNYVRTCHWMQYYWNINDLIRVKNIIEKERLRRWMVRDEKKKKRKKEKMNFSTLLITLAIR